MFSQEDMGSPGTRVIGVCELSGMGAGIEPKSSTRPKSTPTS